MHVTETLLANRWRAQSQRLKSVTRTNANLEQNNRSVILHPQDYQVYIIYEGTVSPTSLVKIRNLYRPNAGSRSEGTALLDVCRSDVALLAEAAEQAVGAVEEVDGRVEFLGWMLA